MSRMSYDKYKESVLLDISELKKCGVRTPSKAKLKSPDFDLHLKELHAGDCRESDAADLIIQLL